MGILYGVVALWAITAGFIWGVGVVLLPPSSWVLKGREFVAITGVTPLCFSLEDFSPTTVPSTKRRRVRPILSLIPGDTPGQGSCEALISPRAVFGGWKLLAAGSYIQAFAHTLKNEQWDGPAGRRLSEGGLC